MPFFSASDSCEPYRALLVFAGFQMEATGRRVWGKKHNTPNTHIPIPSYLCIIRRYEKPWNTGAVIVPQQMAYVVERYAPPTA